MTFHDYIVILDPMTTTADVEVWELSKPMGACAILKLVLPGGLKVTSANVAPPDAAQWRIFPAYKPVEDEKRDLLHQ